LENILLIKSGIGYFQNIHTATISKVFPSNVLVVFLVLRLGREEYDWGSLEWPQSSKTKDSNIRNIRHPLLPATGNQRGRASQTIRTLPNL
jgi:hypothetical protein